MAPAERLHEDEVVGPGVGGSRGRSCHGKAACVLVLRRRKRRGEGAASLHPAHTRAPNLGLPPPPPLTTRPSPLIPSAHTTPFHHLQKLHPPPPPSPSCTHRWVTAEEEEGAASVQPAAKAEEEEEGRGEGGKRDRHLRAPKEEAPTEETKVGKGAPPMRG